MEVASDDPWIGRTLGRYTIAKLIGTGGMSRVYLAEQAQIGSRVAIKILGEDSARDADMLERFFAEARAVNLIAHENIVAVLDLDRSPEGRPYIVMEYVDGVTLARLVRGQHVAIGGAIDVVCETLDALHAAHAIGIIHRDLKPDNVLVTAAGHAKVSDFGIAKLAPHLPDRVRTRTGMLLGTPAFMAPEQIRGGDIDARTDVYAAGVTLFEAVTGSLPFTGPTDFDVLEAHVHKEPPSPRASRPELPVEVERMILRALAKRPEDRFATAADMAEVLRGAARMLADDQRTPLRRRPVSIEPAVDPSAPTPPAPSAVRGRPSVSTPPRPPKVSGRRTLLLGIVAGAVLATAAVLAVQAVGGNPHDDARVPPGPSVNAMTEPMTPPTKVATNDAPAPPPTESPKPSPPKGLTPIGASTKPDASVVHDAATVHIGANVNIDKTSPHESFDGPAPTDPHHFDALAYIPTARALARKMRPDAELVDFTIRGVAPDGYADFALNDGYIPAQYAFRSQAASSPPANQPRTPNWQGDCMIHVQVDTKRAHVLLASSDCKAPFLDAPRCTFAQVWAIAQRDGVGPNQVATIKPDVDGRWQLDLGTETKHITCP